MIDFFNYLLNGFLQGQIYALLALGFMVIYRASKVFNFAQGELMMLGAYAVWTLTLGANLSPWLGIPLAFICAHGLRLVDRAAVLRAAGGRVGVLDGDGHHRPGDPDPRHRAGGVGRSGPPVPGAAAARRH